MVLKALAGGFSFAHLAGLSRSTKADKDLRDQHDEETAAAAAAAAETEECDDEEADEDAAAGTGDKKGEKKGKKSKKSEDDEGDDETSEGEDDGDDEDEDQDEEAAEEGKGKKAAVLKTPKADAKAPAKTGASDFKRGRKAERRRIGLILSNPAAAANLAFASKLACNTGMSSSAAIALLEQTPAQPAARGGRLDQRMQQTGIPDVKTGAPDAATGSKAIQDSWATAFKAAQ